jgi:hypothetical protein
MVFKLTKHAKKRMLERGIELPDETMNMKAAGRKTRRKTRRRIREACKKKGLQGGTIYWTRRDGTVYVCAQEDIGVYCVITAFNLNEHEKKEEK